MVCSDLKKSILDNSLDLSYLIFIYKDNKFLCNEYINEIAKRKNLNIVYVSNVKDIPEYNDTFGLVDNNLYVLNQDKLELTSTKYRNVIFVCKEVNVKDNVVKFPELEKWQVLEYMKVMCSGLSADELEWLYTISKGNIYRIEQEVKKIGVFQPSRQSDILNLLGVEENYEDLNPLTIFNFINYMMRRELNDVARVLKSIDYIDIEGTGVVTLLRTNIKNLIKVKFINKNNKDDNTIANALDLSYKQFKAISNIVENFTENQLVDIYEFLTSIDYKLKNGELQMTNSRLVDYIVCNFLALVV